MYLFSFFGVVVVVVVVVVITFVVVSKSQYAVISTQAVVSSDKNLPPFQNFIFQMVSN